MDEEASANERWQQVLDNTRAPLYLVAKAVATRGVPATDYRDVLKGLGRQDVKTIHQTVQSRLRTLESSACDAFEQWIYALAWKVDRASMYELTKTHAPAVDDGEPVVVSSDDDDDEKQPQQAPMDESDSMQMGVQVRQQEDDEISITSVAASFVSGEPDSPRAPPADFRMASPEELDEEAERVVDMPNARDVGYVSRDESEPQQEQKSEVELNLLLRDPATGEGMPASPKKTGGKLGPATRVQKRNAVESRELRALTKSQTASEHKRHSRRSEKRVVHHKPMRWQLPNVAGMGPDDAPT